MNTEKRAARGCKAAILLLSPALLHCDSRVGILPKDTATLVDTVQDHDTGSRDTGSPTEALDTAEPTDTADYSAWESASLKILNPESGDFLLLAEAAEFQAMVYDSWGEPTDFDDIQWTSDIDATWTPTGDYFVTDSLTAGEHALTASAELPNGDRLAYSIGGVLVQSAYSGTYTGTIIVDGTANLFGTDLWLTCAGSSTLVVDIYGEAVTGDASCLASLGGYYDLTISYLIDAVNSDGSIEGQASVDFSWFTYDMAMEGSLSEDGDMEISFADDVYGYFDLAGDISAIRISRDTQLE